MRLTQTVMTMPAVVEVINDRVTADDIAKIFSYFTAVDDRFSAFKPSSEVTRYNAGRLRSKDLSPDLQEVLRLSEQTKIASAGFFDIQRDGFIDPAGLVKGWAIQRGAELLRRAGFNNFYVEIAGDIELAGHDRQGQAWRIGIRHPADPDQLVKVVALSNRGIATSGTAERGAHIIDPHTGLPVKSDVVSLTVIGPNVYEADRFATAAFAMGPSGIAFIERQPELEGYQVDSGGTATMTSGFDSYTVRP